MAARSSPISPAAPASTRRRAERSSVNRDLYLGFGGATATYTFGGNGLLNVGNSPNTSNALFIGQNGTFNQYGGTVNGYVVNGGQFTFQGGAFNGTLENTANGTADFSSFVFFGAGLKNHGTLNIGLGGQVGTAAGQTFSNDGTSTSPAPARSTQAARS